MMEGAISALKESGSTDANDANAQGHRSCDGKQENSVLYFFLHYRHVTRIFQRGCM